LNKTITNYHFHYFFHLLKNFLFDYDIFSFNISFHFSFSLSCLYYDLFISFPFVFLTFSSFSFSSRRNWTEFNLPYMAVGCAGLTAILMFFSYIISFDITTTEDEKKKERENSNTKKDQNSIKRIAEAFASNSSELASNFIYFLVLLSMAIFHSISVFSNSFIIEVISHVFVILLCASSLEIGFILTVFQSVLE
jgi:hypothetical protein